MQPQTTYGPVEIWNSMGPVGHGVLIALFIMSFYSIGVMIDRWLLFRKAQKQSLKFVWATRRLLAEGQRVICGFDEPGDAGLWEARFDDDFGAPEGIVYFYSVAARKYLTSDQEGNLAVNGEEPNETARWVVAARTEGVRVTPCQFPYSYLRLWRQNGAKAIYGTAPWIGWDIDQLWRVKTSDNPKSNSAWRREHVPGPD